AGPRGGRWRGFLLSVTLPPWRSRLGRCPFGTPAPPRRQALPDLGLEPAVGRPVVLPPAEGIGQVLLVDARLGRVVGVLIAGAVAEPFHEPGGRIAYVQRHSLGRTLPHVRLCLLVGDVNRVGLRRQGPVERGLGDV